MIGSSNAVTPKLKYTLLGERTDAPSGTVTWSNITTSVLSQYDFIWVGGMWYNHDSSTGMVYSSMTPMFVLTQLGRQITHVLNESSYWYRYWVEGGVLKTSTSSMKVRYIYGLTYGGGGLTDLINIPMGVLA